MGFEHDARHLRADFTQRLGGCPLVGHHIRIAELDARLDHDADDPREGSLQARRREGAAMHVDRLQSRFGPRHRDRFQRVLDATRHGHFGSDHINRTRIARGHFRNLGKRRRAPCRNLIRQGRRLAPTPHARVEMELDESGARIGIDHDLGLRHGLIDREPLPRIGAEVIAAEQQSL